MFTMSSNFKGCSHSLRFLVDEIVKLVKRELLRFFTFPRFYPSSVDDRMNLLGWITYMHNV